MIPLKGYRNNIILRTRIMRDAYTRIRNTCCVRAAPCLACGARILILEAPYDARIPSNLKRSP